MATHSCILAWRIPWTEEPGGLQSAGSQRVKHDWVANTQRLVRVQKHWKPHIQGASPDQGVDQTVGFLFLSLISVHGITWITRVNKWFPKLQWHVSYPLEWCRGGGQKQWGQPQPNLFVWITWPGNSKQMDRASTLGLLHQARQLYLPVQTLEGSGQSYVESSARTWEFLLIKDTYVWNLNYDTNEFIYKTETDSRR